MRRVPIVVFALATACTSGASKPPPSDAPTDAGSSNPDAGTTTTDGGESGDAGVPDAAVADAGQPDGGEADAGGFDGGAPPVVIVMIGDGMGFPQVEGASHYVHGRAGALAMEQLPVRGEIRTASLSGLTDSAASATAMSAGVKTTNRFVGMDSTGAPVETTIELAQRLGMATGVVTSAQLAHATPASFSGHFIDRDGFPSIAASQALVMPDIMLGGGHRYFADHVTTFEAAGFSVVRSADELMALDPATTQVLGLFAEIHMPYVLDRTSTSTAPSLAAMSMQAIQRLSRDPEGFMLMIEGARIDMAAHENQRDHMIAETADFDEAVAAVDAWAASRENVTLIVTADHECGGVTITSTGGVGVFPELTFRGGNHTNQRVGVYARGPMTEVFDQTIRDNTWVHAVSVARLTNTAVVAPAPGLVVDGALDDLRYIASTQVVATGFGDGINQLDSLRLDADADRLAIGIEGLFEWGRNAVIVLIDIDFGAGTGHASLDGSLSDGDGRLDSIVTAMGLSSPGVAGFGADAVVGVWGGQMLRDEDLSDNAGFRGLVSPIGEPQNFFWSPISTNFGEGVRTAAVTAAAPGEGWEVHIPWSVLYPAATGGVVPGATIAVAAVLVNDDGGFMSNQALPPFVTGTPNPGRTITPLPGIVSFPIDQNADGVPGDVVAPIVRP